MSSSPERHVLRGDLAASAGTLATPDLRAGAWTRLGGHRVLGDAVTEQTLDSLAETTRTAARSQGYAVGWAQGRREAAASARLAAEATEQRLAAEEARREAEHRDALSALEAAAEQLRTALGLACDRVEEQASGLALELTRELVGHELAVSSAPGEHAVRRALALLPDGTPARLRLHPEVAATVTAPAGVTVVADAGLGRGDALVETDDRVLDLRVDAALDRLREVLG